jgi:hypothetical protein
MLPQASACSAGDSAAYERRASGMDDVVIVSALRTPITKVLPWILPKGDRLLVPLAQEQQVD